MALADDLLHQAEHLAAWDKRKPKQANLRRAISSAYYSLFHLVVAAAVQSVSPEKTGQLPLRIARAVTHADISSLCMEISKSPSQELNRILPAGFSEPMRMFARMFANLQDARHRADYDLSITYSRSDVLQILKQARLALQLWDGIKQSREVTVFLAAVLFAKRWKR